LKLKRTGGLALIIFLMFIMLNLASNLVYADQKDNINMKITYGIEGKYKNNLELPINIEIENSGQKLSGQVEVRVQTNIYDTYDAFACDIEVDSNEKKTVTIPINLYENSSKIVVVLKDGDKILKENKMTISGGRVNEYSMLIGTITDDINSINIRNLNFDIDGRYGDANKNVNVTLDMDTLGESYKNISALDMIIINNYNTSEFTGDHYKNLLEWVGNGGILVIGTGENSAKTIKDNKLDIIYNGTRDINGYTLADLEMKNSSVLLEKNGENLIYGLEHNKGHIYVAAFDLSNQNISKEDYIEYFWKETIGKNFTNKVDNAHRYMDSNYSPYELTNLINNIPLGEDLNIIPIIIIFIVYCLIVGILVYFVMKKLGKRELLWGIIPIISIVFSVILFAMGTNTRINDVALNQVNFIVNDGTEESNVNGYIGVAIKNRGKLVVKEPNGLTLKALIEDNYYRNSDNSQSGFKKLGSKTVYKENNSYYEFQDLSSLEMKKFNISNYEQIVPQIGVNLKYDSNILLGNVKNTLGYDIERLLVVSSNSVWDVGGLKVNQEKEINSKPNTSVGLSEYSSNLMDSYHNIYKNGNSKDNKEKYKNVIRIENIVSALSQMNLNSSSTYLVAITDMPIDYGFNFDNRSISKYDTTVVTQKIDIDFTDKDGYLNYPMGYFKPTVISSSAYMYVDNNYNEISGQGDAILKYEIDSNLDVMSIVVGNLNKQYQSSGKQKISIYNNETEQYELIDIRYSGTNLDDPNAYIKDAVVKIQVNLDEDGYTQIPQIAVKGRAK